MQLKLSTPLRLFLLAVVVAALGATESSAYINLGFKSRQEFEDFCKRHNLDPKNVGYRDIESRKPPPVLGANDYCDRGDDLARSWLTRIMLPSYLFNASMSKSQLCMSRWFVGSSSIRKLALLTITFANATLAFSPPLRILIFLSASSPLKRKHPSKPRSSSSVI